MKPYNKRGFYGVVLYQPKFSINLGSIIRNAACFSADFIALVGARYQHSRADTGKFTRHIPLHQYDNLDQFVKSAPQNAQIICVENYTDLPHHNLGKFVHPERAMYIMGAEDSGLPREFVAKYTQVTIESIYGLNVAQAAGIVMHHRVSNA